MFIYMLDYENNFKMKSGFSVDCRAKNGVRISNLKKKILESNTSNNIQRSSHCKN